VQEDPPPLKNRYFDTSVFSPVNSFAGTARCEFKFVKSYNMAADGHHTYGYYRPSQTFKFQNSEFHGGRIESVQVGMTFTNCLLNRVWTLFSQDGDPFTLSFGNCLFHGGSMIIAEVDDTAPWTFSNSVFDHHDFQNWGDVPEPLYENYNAFVLSNSPFSTKAHDLYLTSDIEWVTGPLGRFYLPTDSSLLNAGSTNANLLGLYHFTTTTNLVNSLQAKETNSIVDMSYHYVAVGAGGPPIDSDADSLSDYLEDGNGDGLFGIGDLSDWTSADTDGDGLSDGDEMLVYHLNPLSQDTDGDHVIDQPFQVIVTRPNASPIVP